jgi:integrase
VSVYVRELAGAVKPSTIARRLSSIAHAHRAARWPSPTSDPGVRAVWAEVRRRPGAPARAIAPLDVALLRRMVEHLPSGLSGLRDRALLLVGFAAGLRRSELAAIDAEGVITLDHGLVLTVGGADRDAGGGRTVGIAYGPDPTMCAVRAVDAWRREAQISTGPLFRPVDRHGRVGRTRLSAAGVNRIVQRALLAAGAEAGRYSAHSLRAGWMAAAASGAVSVLAGVSEAPLA